MSLHKLVIIQARMSSSRLPGKVMMDIAGQPMLWHVIRRARRARSVDQVVVATTTDPTDDVLEKFCQKVGIACFRGSLPDVLDRFYRAAIQFHADVIIRVTADCPLIDPDLLDRTVSVFLRNPQATSQQVNPMVTSDVSPNSGFFDFAANRLPPPWRRTIPIGLDVEVCSLEALERAWKESDQLYQREHVMPYLYEGVEFSQEGQPADNGWYIQENTTRHKFKIALLNHYPDYGAFRWTVDTPADLEFVRQVYTHFNSQDDFTWQQVLSLINDQPELASINAQVRHKTAFDVDKRSGPS